MSYPSFQQKKLPYFNDIQPSQIEPQIQSLLTKNRQKLAEVLSQTGPYTWDNLMLPLEDMHDELNNKWAPLSHLHSVLETEELREVYNKVLPLLTQYNTELSQNEKLFQAISTLANSSEFAQLNAAQQKIIQNDIRDFKLAGIHLSADKKARLAMLQQKISQLATKFSENLLDATQAFTLQITDPNEVKNLPPQALELAIENAKRRGLEGYVLTLDYPSYSTALRFLDNRALRKQLYEAYTTRASELGPNAGQWDNTVVMEEILQIRHEMAQLVEFDNYADYSLATKMAKTAEEVLTFLNELVIKSKPIAEQEYQDIINFAKKLDGLDPIYAWDLPYYSEKLREQEFDFSPEALRPYFPIDTVLGGMFTLVNKLYGIHIQEQPNIEVWHKDVRFFAIYDEHNALRAGFYIDLYARPHKRDGAWMDECRSRRRMNGEIEYPVAFLTCNFMPPLGDQPALLTHDEVVTLFHEFGHCLHHMLTQIDYPTVGGINGVPWDAVEFPSQFMEYYCWEKESLDFIAAHYQTGAHLPDELYQKMIDAKHFQTGLQMLRQLEFALFDFRLHLEYNPEQIHPVATLLQTVREAVSVIPVPEFNRFANSFSHIFGGGYAAGYYSYKWAEVLSADAYAQFEENGIFDRVTGQAFLSNILEVGGSRDPMVSFVAFRGRKPTIDALLRHSGIN